MNSPEMGNKRSQSQLLPSEKLGALLLSGNARQFNEYRERTGEEVLTIRGLNSLNLKLNGFNLTGVTLESPAVGQLLLVNCFCHGKRPFRIENGTVDQVTFSRSALDCEIVNVNLERVCGEHCEKLILTLKPSAQIIGAVELSRCRAATMDIVHAEIRDLTISESGSIELGAAHCTIHDFACGNNESSLFTLVESELTRASVANSEIKALNLSRCSAEIVGCRACGKVASLSVEDCDIDQLHVLDCSDVQRITVRGGTSHDLKICDSNISAAEVSLRINGRVEIRDSAAGSVKIQNAGGKDCSVSLKHTPFQAIEISGEVKVVNIERSSANKLHLTGLEADELKLSGTKVEQLNLLRVVASLVCNSSSLKEVLVIGSRLKSVKLDAQSSVSSVSGDNSPGSERLRSLLSKNPSKPASIRDVKELLKEAASFIEVPGFYSHCALLVTAAGAQHQMRALNIKPYIPPLHMLFEVENDSSPMELANIYSDLLKKLNLIPFAAQVVQAIPGDLIAKYVGQTARETRAFLETAKQGLVVVSKFNELLDGNDFGKEAWSEIESQLEKDPAAFVLLATVGRTVRDDLVREQYVPYLKAEQFFHTKLCVTALGVEQTALKLAARLEADGLALGAFALPAIIHLVNHKSKSARQDANSNEETKSAQASLPHHIYHDIRLAHLLRSAGKGDDAKKIQWTDIRTAGKSDFTLDDLMTMEFRFKDEIVSPGSLDEVWQAIKASGDLRSSSLRLIVNVDESR